jgi:hypothetical protein
MVADSNTQINAVAGSHEGAGRDAVAETAKAAAKAGEQTAPRPSARLRRRQDAQDRKTHVARPPRRPARPHQSAPQGKARKRQAAASRTERNDQMKFDPTNAFAGFGAFPGRLGIRKAVHRSRRARRSDCQALAQGR